MVEIRDYKDSDYEEIVKMYYQLLHDVYPYHTIKPIQHSYRNVLNWIALNYDIMVTYDESEVTGFTMCFIDSMGGAVEDYLQADVIYVKPEYRKGRSAYLLYTTVMAYADNLGLLIATNASDVTESSHISSKLGKLIYSHYERLPDVKQ